MYISKMHNLVTSDNKSLNCNVDSVHVYY